MKRLVLVIIAVIALLAAGLPLQAKEDGPFGHRHGHLDFGIFLGPAWHGHGYWVPSPYYPFYPYYPKSEPPRGSDQQQPQEAASGLWYFCPERQGYYPAVKECPRSWMLVAPPVHPPAREEEVPTSPPPGE